MADSHSHHHHNHHNHHHHHNHEPFNPEKLFNAFSDCLKKSSDSSKDFDDVSLNSYLNAYTEITKFLELLGHVFYFVISDVKEKVDILDDYLKQDQINYDTFQSLIKHEKSLNHFKQPLANKKLSGTRHILRLHRALIFIYKFLDQLMNADQKCKTSQICCESYDSTLAKYHPWLVRKAATFGMMTLPKREVLVGYMCRNETELQQFPIFLEKLKKTYDITQSLYEQHQILDLP